MNEKYLTILILLLGAIIGFSVASYIKKTSVPEVIDTTGIYLE